MQFGKSMGHSMWNAEFFSSLPPSLPPSLRPSLPPYRVVLLEDGGDRLPVLHHLILHASVVKGLSERGVGVRVRLRWGDSVRMQARYKAGGNEGARPTNQG